MRILSSGQRFQIVVMEPSLDNLQELNSSDKHVAEVMR
jgi:hypothetical protein